MKVADKPQDEQARLLALESYNILDTLPEQAYDDITYIASTICKTPISLVSLVDKDRQWFKSKVGLKVDETDRDLAFCSHAILEPNNLLIVPDAHKDERFKDNPLVVENPQIRFYAGAVLDTDDGHGLGTLCVIDTKPRRLNETQIHALQALARQTMAQLNLKKSMHDLERIRKAKKLELLEELRHIRED